MTTLTQKDLFAKAYSLENEILTAQELLKELKSDYTYHEEFNPKGMSKDDVASTLKAARAFAKANDLKEKSDELLAIDALIQELS